MKHCPTCHDTLSDDARVCPKDGTPVDAPVAASAVDAPLAPGAVLGTYKILDVLGEGGMGRVYLAEHTRLGRKVALKQLRAEYVMNPAAAERFFAEARAVNQIHHDNIVAITDFFDTDPQQKYYIMELLSGRTLNEVQRDEALPLSRQLAIALQVADALVATHAAGIVHRDLKPDNIFLTKHGGRTDFVKILDFGVAKLLDVREGRPLSTTQVGAIIGTPEYMSPEQVSGRVVDPRSDIYSLGVILYELATRRKPLEAKSFGEMVVKHLTVTPPRPSKLKDLPEPIPKPLEDLILQCLEKDPAHRPQTMSEVHLRLRALAAGDEDTLSKYRPLPSRTHRRAMWAGAAAAGFVLVGIVVGIAMMSTDGAPVTEVRALPPPPPTASHKVRVDLDSLPRGASVRLTDSSTTLGITPTTLSLPRTVEPRQFIFSLSGYDDVVQTIMLTEDARVLVTLAKPSEADADPGTGPRRKGRRSPDRRGTLDPFAE